MQHGDEHSIPPQAFVDAILVLTNRLDLESIAGLDWDALDLPLVIALLRIVEPSSLLLILKFFSEAH